MSNKIPRSYGGDYTDDIIGERECLEVMNCYRQGKNEWVGAHEKLGRNR